MSKYKKLNNQTVTANSFYVELIIYALKWPWQRRNPRMVDRSTLCMWENAKNLLLHRMQTVSLSTSNMLSLKFQCKGMEKYHEKRWPGVHIKL